MFIIGIDPGFNGAIAILSTKSELYSVVDIPILKNGKKKEIDISEVVDIFSTYSKKHIFIEDVHAMPGQGVTSMFTFALNYGLLLGAIKALKIPFTKVIPQRWKKSTMDGMPKEKGSSVIRVKQIYPGWQTIRKNDDGRADAILIGVYGLSTLHGLTRHKELTNSDIT